MPEPKWLSRQIVDLIHQELVAEHGGAHGVRAEGEGLIESALARAQQRYAYAPDSDLAALSAAYLFGLGKNHGYIDGNKRVAFAAAATFLLLNGVRLTASEIEAYEVVIGLIESRYDEEEIAAWIRMNSEPAETA
jgi:death on curing protein